MSDDLRPGKRIAGRYVVEARIGAGGMGSVYRARDLFNKGGLAALKLVPADVDEAEYRVQAQRLEREGQVLRGLDHPHLVKVLDCGWPEGESPYIVMELIQGRPLSSEAHLLHRITAVRVTRTVLDVLRYMHSKGAFHGDIKPSNVLLEGELGSRTYKVKVVDLGVAGDAQRAPLTTGEQAIVGTPTYLDPARTEGAPADVYAAATLLYNLVFGLLPVPRKPGESDADYLLRKQSTVVVAPSDDRHGEPVPEAFRKILERALAVDPARRYALNELDDALDRWEEEASWAPPPRPPRSGPWLLVAASTFVLGAGLVGGVSLARWALAGDPPATLDFCGSSTVGQRLAPALLGRYLGVDVGGPPRGD